MNLVNIYILESDNDNKVYIGKTKKPIERRLSNHIYESKHGCETNKCLWLVNSNNINISLLDEVLDSEWEFWEKYWISQYKTWGFDLVNSNNGGGGVTHHSDGFSKWLSERNKGNKNMLGKTHSEKTRKRLSEVNKGRIGHTRGKKLPNKWRENLRKPKKPNKKYFRDCGCGVTLGYSNKSSYYLAERKNTKCRTCFQTGRKYSEETKIKMRNSKGREGIKVNQLTKNGELIKIWNTIDSAEKGLNIWHITSVCKGKRKTSGGFKWEYV